MDSPLMPTLKGHHADSSDLLADLSLMDGDETFLAGSPLTTRPPAFPMRSSSPPSGSARGLPPPPDFLRGGNRRADNGDEPPLLPTEIKPRPRFSLFAPLRSAGQPTQSKSAEAGEPKARTAPKPAPAEEEGEEVGDETIGPDQIGQRADEQDREAGDHGEEAGIEGEGDQTIHASTRMTAEERDDRLRESLYELRSMNEVFDGFLEALESARGHNERLETRVKQTKSLLDHYTLLLGQTHHTQQLLSNPKWTGVTDETARIEAEEAEREAEAERQRLAEEQAAEAARHAEEERARRAQEAAEAKERATAQIRGRGRGRRWGATSTRGARGMSYRPNTYLGEAQEASVPESAQTRQQKTRAQGLTSAGTGIPTTSRIPSASSRSAPTASRIGTIASSTKVPGTGVKRTVRGTGSGSGEGKYAHVASSGYGASGRRAL